MNGSEHSTALRFQQAEELLASLLARGEEFGTQQVEALLAAHPELEHELRSLIAQLDDLQDGFEDEACSVIEERVRLRRIVAHLADPAEYGQRYVVQEEIGRGGMGVVYRAYDRRLSRTLALKVIRDPAGSASKGPHAAPRTRAWTRFLNEVRITARLDHPGIVPVHEVGVNPEGQVYFTMKLVKGRTLAEVLRMQRQAEGDWTLSRVLGLFRRVCEAVEFAHGQGVIHRDLKPSNIMVGDFGEVYVMDWGVARASQDEDVAAPADPDGGWREFALGAMHTREGELIGTPAYMSPEQARGDVAGLGPWSDVYSIGAMLYELICGSPPYVEPHERPSGGEILRRVIEGSPRPLRARDIPVELVAICEKALEREPKHRYATVGELAEDIERWLGGRSVRALATGPWNELGKWWGRNRVLATALAACTVVLVGGLVFGWFKSRETYAAQLETMAKDKELEEAGRQTATVRASANAVGDAWIRLLDEMNPIVQRNAPGSFAELLRRATVQIAGLESMEPGMRGRLHLRIGKTLNALGEPRSAVEALWNAEALLREGGDPTAGEYREALLRLGHAEIEVGAIEEAQVHIRRFLDLSRQGGEDGDERAICNAQLSLANQCTVVGLLAEASEFLDDVYLLLASRDSPENDTDGVDSDFAFQYHRYRADLQFRSGEFVAAEVSYLRSLEIAIKLNAPPPFKASAHLGLSRLYCDTGRTTDARVEVESALALLRGMRPAPTTLQAAALDQLGAIAFRMGDAPDALERAREALELLLRSAGQRAPETARSQVNLATTLLKATCPDEAESLLAKALDTFRSTFGEDHPETLGAMLTLAWSREEQGREQEALVLYGGVLHERKRGGGLLPAREAEFRARFARLLLRAGRRAEARDHAALAMELAPSDQVPTEILRPLLLDLGIEPGSSGTR